MSEQDKLQKLMAVLASSPTSADLDYLVSEYTYVGYLAATAESDAEMAEAERKHAEATMAAEIREKAAANGDKVTEAAIGAKAMILTFDHKKAEIRAYEKARKLKNLLESVEQAINAIKFLGRNGG